MADIFSIYLIHLPNISLLCLNFSINVLTAKVILHDYFTVASASVIGLPIYI